MQCPGDCCPSLPRELQYLVLQGKYDLIKPNECPNHRAHKEEKREEELARLQHEFAAKKEQLRTLVDQHNLRDVDPLGMLCLLCNDHQRVLHICPRDDVPNVIWCL